LRYAAQTLSHPGIQVLELDVSLSNLRAQKLYERLGFRVIKETLTTAINRSKGFAAWNAIGSHNIGESVDVGPTQNHIYTGSIAAPVKFAPNLSLTNYLINS
jgi:hypothetical protein